MCYKTDYCGFLFAESAAQLMDLIHQFNESNASSGAALHSFSFDFHMRRKLFACGEYEHFHNAEA